MAYGQEVDPGKGQYGGGQNQFKGSGKSGKGYSKLMAATKAGGKSFVSEAAGKVSDQRKDEHGGR